MEKNRETCEYHNEGLGDDECLEHAWKDSKRGYCIFHSESPNKPVEDFEKGIEEKLEEKDYDFGGFCFPERFDSRKYFAGREFKKNVRFDFAKFLGSVFFERAKFSGKETSFNSAKFAGEGGTFFDRAEFSGKGDTSFIGAKFLGKGGTYFYKTIFSGEMTSFVKAEFFGKMTYFNEAKFSAKGGTFFNEAEFSGKITSFKEAKFSGKGGTYFDGTKFSGEGGTYFNDVKFYGRWTSFDGTKFSGKNVTSFYKARFLGERTSFREATFSKSVSFLDSIFYCDKVDFSGIGFKGESVSFTGALFAVEVRFENTVFSNERVNFWNTAFDGQVIFKKSRFYNNVDFDKTIFNCAEFASARFIRPEIVSFYDVDLKKVSFLGTDVSKVDFYDCKWPEIDGRLGIFDGINNRDDSSLKKIEIVYRQLKQNFEERRNYPDAGDFYIGEMEARRRNLNKKKNPLEYLFLVFYKYVSLYGESFGRALTWIFVLLAFGGILFMLIGYNVETPDKDKIIEIDYGFISDFSEMDLKKSFYDWLFSIITVIKVITLQIRSNIFMSKFGIAIQSLTTIFGIVLLGLFVLAIKRRFRR